MKKQTYFVFGILIGVLLVFSVSLSHGADYGSNDEPFTSTEEDIELTKEFSYYEIKIDDDTYLCMSYKIEKGIITLQEVFMEGTSEKYSEFIVMKSDEIEYIKKKKELSKKKVVKNESSCFINTASGGN